MGARTSETHLNTTINIKSGGMVSFVFAKKQPEQASGKSIVVLLQFGRWPSKYLVGVTEQQMHEIKRNIRLKDPLSDEQVVFDVLRGNGGKQQVKQ